MIESISIWLLYHKQALPLPTSVRLSHSHTPSHATHIQHVSKMHGGLFIIGGVLQLTNKYLEMKSSGQDMFTQTLLRDFMADVSL